MRTTLVLDDDLFAEAQRLTGLREKSAVVRAALNALIQRESRAGATPVRAVAAIGAISVKPASMDAGLMGTGPINAASIIEAAMAPSQAGKRSRKRSVAVESFWSSAATDPAT